MSDDLKQIAHRTLEEIFPRCDTAALAEVTDPDIVAHGARPDEPPGIEGVRRTMLWLAQVFSDQRWEIHQAIREDDVVVLRATHHGRHTGNLMGIPPTGRLVAYDYVHILRFRDGKAIEHWGFRDDATLMRQLGVAADRPTPSAAGV
jgi:predicted ester cyclase